ncbi:uncharacterized protein G2W53_007994 [Senna tora]|uniref:Uncharacterized protein n=1 Tax=Senna tora TaxID=362788 RepID=A0A834X7H6_9FABA|nr:uncharacterized protein G2W53_007994 [Senna tora]
MEVWDGEVLEKKKKEGVEGLGKKNGV